MDNSFFVNNERNTISIPKETGKILFQFDNDVPVEMGIIFDYARFTLELQQTKSKPDEIITSNCSIVFRSPKGKSFKLFIKDS